MSYSHMVEVVGIEPTPFRVSDGCATITPYLKKWLGRVESNHRIEYFTLALYH